MKQVIVLVGPKGAGKTTIGHLLETELGVHFVRVEPIFLRVRHGAAVPYKVGGDHPEFERRGFEAVLQSLREALSRYDTVCFETTGASSHVPWLFSELRQLARVSLVRVVAAPAQCVERIHSRDLSLHIPVSDDQVERINDAAVRVELPWAAEIDNRGAFAPAAIVAVIRDHIFPNGVQ